MLLQISFLLLAEFHSSPASGTESSITAEEQRTVEEFSVAETLDVKLEEALNLVSNGDYIKALAVLSDINATVNTIVPQNEDDEREKKIYRVKYLYVMARLQEGMGFFEKAISYARQGIKLSRETGFEDPIPDFYRIIGVSYIQLGRFRKGKEPLRKES